MSHPPLARLLRRCDWPLLACVAGLVAVSLPTIYSATLRLDGSPNLTYLTKQVCWLAAGTIVLLLINTLDHHEFAELARPVYWLSIAGLLATVILGREVNGAKSWIDCGGFRLQPSEFTKLALVLALARFFTIDEADGSDIKDIVRSGAIVGLPLLFILAQPDLGTAISFVAAWVAMLWWGGCRWWQLLLILSLGLLLGAVMWHFDILAPYQKARVAVLFNPDVDPRGQGYNLRQSLIAVGSGGLWGKGWLQGTQTHLRFLPERHTDFIFAVLCEERGLVGAAVLIGLYIGLFFRGLGIVEQADTPFGRALAFGCLTFLLFHVVFNIGMVVGLLPITGLPLPFVSYGGSHLLTCLALLGVVLNVGMRRVGFQR